MSKSKVFGLRFKNIKDFINNNFYNEVIIDIYCKYQISNAVDQVNFHCIVKLTKIFA